MAEKPEPVPMGARQFLTRDELAARWRVHRKTVSRRYKRLGLRPIRVVGRMLFALEEIEEAERQNTDRVE